LCVPAREKLNLFYLEMWVVQSMHANVGNASLMLLNLVSNHFINLLMRNTGQHCNDRDK
jgi:hypothetical protein